jgi:hypothetical protein
LARAKLGYTGNVPAASKATEVVLMLRAIHNGIIQKATAILCVLLLPIAGLAQAGPQAPPAGQFSGQFPDPSQAPQQAPLLSPDQLANLLAPVALYPDQLLGEVLAAATYPLEIMEAQQWLQQNLNLRGPQLIEAAKQQNWDPSIQAMVAFPDVMSLLARDIRWTTDLGNAFLAQQADVMNAIQNLRARAQQNGRLRSTPQQNVTMEAGNGQSAIQIQPANPQVVYVPSYNPQYVWGPPAYGAYPPMWYPPVNSGFGFGPGVFLSSLFSGLLGFGGWGWGLSWLSNVGLFLNGLFFHNFGFGGFHGGVGTSWWAHNPGHRLGVAYPNRALASRFGAPSRMEAARSGYRSFDNRGFENRGFNAAPRSNGYQSFNRGAEASRGFEQNYRGSAPAQSYARNFSNAERSNSNRYSAPRASSQHFSAPKASRGGGHFSAPHSSGKSGGGGHSKGSSSHHH